MLGRWAEADLTEAGLAPGLPSVHGLALWVGADLAGASWHRCFRVSGGRAGSVGRDGANGFRVSRGWLGGLGSDLTGAGLAPLLPSVRWPGARAGSVGWDGTEAS
ncbi:hypothetical protein GCM10010483_46860 [Actinokineospora diospyrosa]